MGENFLLQQALFGYESGHHLLRSSVPLPPEVRHLLAVATDSSGSAPAKGFDVAYTGMPLPGFNFYAIFCTWPAPEMPRPGCVWSHVLLIELADLAEIADLGYIRDCFQRPSNKTIDRFGEPLSFYVPEYRKLAPRAIKSSVARHLTAALYDPSEHSLVISASSATEFEDLIFAIWSQQWPKLRRSFRFSSGSFADRGRGSAPFDLQVTPSANRRAWQSGGRLLVVDPDGASSGSRVAALESWVETAVDDLLVPDKDGLRSFLRIYGIDINNPRHAFQALVKSFEFLTFSPSDAWNSVLINIAAEFTRPDEALLLKQVSVSSRSGITGEVSVDRVWAVMNYLCHEAPNGAYRKVSYDFEAHMQLLWPARRESIIDLLARPPEIDAADRWSNLLKAVANIIKDADVAWLWTRQPNLLPAFVRLNPALATYPDTWKLPDRVQWQIAEVLENQPLPAEQWEYIVLAMLSAGTSTGVRDVVQSAGSSALDGALRWTNGMGNQATPFIWRDVLQPLADRRLHDEVLEPISLAFCVSLLPPKTAEKISPHRDDVQNLARTRLDALPENLRTHTAFFLLTLGLQTDNKIGFILVSRSFFAVHAALAQQRESPESWRLLRSHLPEVYPWDDWDRCKMVRRAVRKWLKDKPAAFRLLKEEARFSSEVSLLDKLQ